MVNAMYKWHLNGVLYRGTTPTIDFNFPFNLETVEKVLITFSIKDKIIFEKENNDCLFDVENEKVYVHLTQEETLALVNDEVVCMQIRVLFIDGEAASSEIMKARVREVLNEVVIAPDN